MPVLDHAKLAHTRRLHLLCDLALRVFSVFEQWQRRPSDGATLVGELAKRLGKSLTALGRRAHVSYAAVVRGVGTLEKSGRFGSIKELRHRARDEPERFG